ncbi:ATP-dependent DNA helicase RecG [Ectobacillus antri]|uniref:ATP-dependent DNA helicase RecG n=1 Tax=Ectobacillus antri TaxID=2486280 RepID=A0ABT6H1F2_9BACI|nr:ATP-dependent DNA helicase RecG [Ectobacillus antri]MDG4655898.1 ATP-dependent DNA helicase RecG [Ectobacillus antri]MDG5752573.1 ATP-dependent DNA helicase RecG [Ectobacillus antri]
MSLHDKVVAVKGIGEETALQLNEMGIVTVNDLLYYLPYRYEDYAMKDLAEVKHEERVTVEGRVHSLPLLQYYGKKKSRLTFRMLVDRYLINVVCFNRPYYKEKLNMNEVVTVTGKWDQHRQTISVTELHFGSLAKQREIEPVYSVKGKITVKQLRRYVSHALEQYESSIQDPLPEGLLLRYKLWSSREALRALHFPSGQEELKQARRRFVYEEFFFFQLKMQALRKIEREQSAGVAKVFSESVLHEFVQSLPFPLTGAQQRVVSEIVSDLKSPYRMNRLLQGDVGSGKTVVAAIGLYAAKLAGYQGALMVPTEILAEQHFHSLRELFQDALQVQLLTSSIKGTKRREVLSQLASGEIDVLVGTHALIQDEVSFARLGFVITDEQHRFGVAQRRVLREKGEQPDVLFMTATPIPRTLAITAFGEMDVSVIDEMPAGRKVIETYWAKHDMFERVLAFVEKELVKGRQAYVICPLIEESEKLDVQNAIDLHSMLTYHFQTFQVGLMHGRLSAQEKEAVMQAFSQNEVQVLVSTTVVEVGVNVPNATVMVIYDAERFGLSQLHQLRGRVGRGSEQSYCILIADPKSEVGKERMRIMTETNDGFVLSEKDLELRGPGDFFGSKQSGLPEFKVADMVHDYRVLEIARTDATLLVNSRAFWEEPQYERLRKNLEEAGVFQGEKLD